MKSFAKWYGRRIRRVYITVWIVGVITCFLTEVSLGWRNILRIFIYPTPYHFIASIMILYIVYYFVMWALEKWQISIKLFNILYNGIVLLLYIFTYDKSVYHIDVVEEHFIRFLFFDAMLIGAYFKEKAAHRCESKRGLSSNMLKRTVVCGVTVVIYFICKIAVSRLTMLNPVQIITWVSILIALYFIFLWAEGTEPFLKSLPSVCQKLIYSLAQLTLQIYLVQFTIIKQFEGLAFPINLIVIVILILLAAELVFCLEQLIRAMMVGIWNDKGDR